MKASTRFFTSTVAKPRTLGARRVPRRHGGDLVLDSLRHDDRSLQLVLATFGQAFPTALGIDGGYPANTSMFKMVRKSNIDEWISAANSLATSRS